MPRFPVPLHPNPYHICPNPLPPYTPYPRFSCSYVGSRMWQSNTWFMCDGKDKLLNVQTYKPSPTIYGYLSHAGSSFNLVAMSILHLRDHEKVFNLNGRGSTWPNGLRWTHLQPLGQGRNAPSAHVGPGSKWAQWAQSPSVPSAQVGPGFKWFQGPSGFQAQVGPMPMGPGPGWAQADELPNLSVVAFCIRFAQTN
jgi:hypothetical protein